MSKDTSKIYDDLLYEDEDVLSSDEIRIAIKEIDQGIPWKESQINPKTPAKKAQWTELVIEIIEAEKNGWVVEIPDEFPDLEE